MPALLESVARFGRGAVSAIRAISGEDAYERYLQHERVAHPGVQPMSERQFWRDRTDRMDNDPGGRCC